MSEEERYDFNFGFFCGGLFMIVLLVIYFVLLNVMS